MGTPGKLHVDKATGHVTGAARIEYNNPFPCVNGEWGSGAMSGVVMHTIVGNLSSAVAVFNQRGYGASAQFGIAQDGLIHQFGPIGKSWIAWHAKAANRGWYGIEHADNRNPDNPLTDAQIISSAQLVECLSAFAGFPLVQTDSPSKGGYGVHFMGGVAWGGHSCPDEPPQHVRSRQRPAILSLAHLIRDPSVPKAGKWKANGTETFVQLCERAGTTIAHALHETAAREPGGYGPWLAKFINSHDLTAVPDKDTVIWT